MQYVNLLGTIPHSSERQGVIGIWVVFLSSHPSTRNAKSLKPLHCSSMGKKSTVCELLGMREIEHYYSTLWKSKCHRHLWFVFS